MVVGTAAPEFLDLDDVLRFHGQALKQFGGSEGIRDLGALEAAIAVPQATFDGTPARVALTIERDSDGLVQQTIEFTYKNFQPNGPQCGGTCLQASASMTVPMGIVGQGSSDDGGTDDGSGGDGSRE